MLKKSMKMSILDSHFKTSITDLDQKWFSTLHLLNLIHGCSVPPADHSISALQDRLWIQIFQAGLIGTAGIPLSFQLPF